MQQIRGGEAGHRRDGREDERFDEQLTDDPPAARAERMPHGDLRLARRGARVDQRPDVRARHDQDEENRQVSGRQADPRPPMKASRAPGTTSTAPYATTPGRRCWWVRGDEAAARSVSAAISACACIRVAPGASLPNTWTADTLERRVP